MDSILCGIAQRLPRTSGAISLGQMWGGALSRLNHALGCQAEGAQFRDVAAICLMRGIRDIFYEKLSLSDLEEIQRDLTRCFIAFVCESTDLQKPQMEDEEALVFDELLLGLHLSWPSARAIAAAEEKDARQATKETSRMIEATRDADELLGYINFAALGQGTFDQRKRELEKLDAVIGRLEELHLGVQGDGSIVGKLKIKSKASWHSLYVDIIEREG